MLERHDVEISVKQALAVEFGVDERFVEVSVTPSRRLGARRQLQSSNAWTVAFIVMIPGTQLANAETKVAEIKVNNSILSNAIREELLKAGAEEAAAMVVINGFEAQQVLPTSTSALTSSSTSPVVTTTLEPTSLPQLTSQTSQIAQASTTTSSTTMFRVVEVPPAPGDDDIGQISEARHGYECHFCMLCIGCVLRVLLGAWQPD